MVDYHSSLREDLKDLKELDFYSSDSGTVFCHNLEDGMTDMFRLCDAIYSEPSWVYGYKIFGARAGKNDGIYKKYLAGMKSVLDELKKPAFIVMGKQAVKVLNPDWVKEIQFIGGNHKIGESAMLMVFNHEAIDAENTHDVQRFVCDRFNTILDFNCGYGSICQGAKRFICSDINRKCVYYVANKYLGAI